jgi:hypothetical protein
VDPPIEHKVRLKADSTAGAGIARSPACSIDIPNQQKPFHISEYIDIR